MLFKLIIVSFLSFYNPPHDVAMAIFAVTLEDNTIQLKVKVDKGDINDVLKISTREAHSTEKIATYISKKTTWLINNQPTTFEFNSIKGNDEYYFLESTPINLIKPLATINLSNTCLIETVEDHSNVIYIKQKGKEMRGFRMTNKRTEISVEF